MSGIKEQKLLMGRQYGGCAILINKTLGYNSIFVETENTRVCSVLSKYDTPTIIFICVYIPNDINSYIYEYNEVLSSIHILQSLYTPNLIIYVQETGIQIKLGKPHFSQSHLFVFVTMKG